MEYNECSICGANNGRAGMLIGNKELGEDSACLNCHDTKKSGNITIHTELDRTPEELEHTFNILINTIIINPKAKT